MNFHVYKSKTGNHVELIEVTEDGFVAVGSLFDPVIGMRVSKAFKAMREDLRKLTPNRESLREADSIFTDAKNASYEGTRAALREERDGGSLQRIEQRQIALERHFSELKKDVAEALNAINARFQAVVDMIDFLEVRTKKYVGGLVGQIHRFVDRFWRKKYVPHQKATREELHALRDQIKGGTRVKTRAPAPQKLSPGDRHVVSLHNREFPFE